MRDDEAPLEEAVADSCGWKDLERLAHSARLTDTMEANPLTHVAQGYHRFRRYAPRMLEELQISAAPVARPLIEAGGPPDGLSWPTLKMAPSSEDAGGR